MSCRVRVAGGTFSLAHEAGHVVLLNYWASWCVPCVTEVPQLDALYREVKPDGYYFVGIDTKDGDRSAPEAFVEHHDISYPVGYDENGRSLLQLGGDVPGLLPSTGLIDKHQRVAAVYLGPLTPADLRPVLTTLHDES